MRILGFLGYEDPGLPGSISIAREEPQTRKNADVHEKSRNK
jgi:hypothetical protein